MQPATGSKIFFQNIRETVKIAWTSDHWLFLILAGLIFITALFPIALSYTFRWLLDGVVQTQKTGAVVTVALLSLLAFRYLISLASDLANSFQSDYVERIFQQKFENRLNYLFAKKLMELDIPHFENAATQSLINKARRAFPFRLINFVIFFLDGLEGLGTFVASFFVLLPFGAWIPLAVVAATVPALFFRSKYVKAGWLRFTLATEESKELNYLSNILSDRTSVKEIRIAQSGANLLGRLQRLQAILLDSIRKPLNDYLVAFYAAIFVEVLVLGLLAYVKLPAAAAGLLTIGTFTFYIQMLERVNGSAERVANFFTRMYEQNLYVGYFFDVLALPKLIQEKYPGFEFDAVAPPRLEFRNVSFHYEDGPAVLKNISFVVNPGEHLAIVGPNGAGKTTLINLLLRFYDPTSGDIFVNDINLKDIRLAHWYKFVSILFQDYMKFTLSIKDNILLGNAELIDETRMMAAAEKAGAHQFISHLPNQYNQRLGKMFENAAELSVGQWQKLALARAFYEAAPVLILDEPTSSIDADAEAEIFDNLDQLYQDKNLILISHRFSTVRNADQIIVIQNGAITESGDHKSLLARNGIYAGMFRKQAKGYID